MKVIPIFYKVDNKSIIIIGNGQHVEAKIHLMLSLGAKVRWLNILSEGCMAFNGSVENIEGAFNPLNLEDAALIFASTENVHLMNQVIAAAKQKNIIFNFIDKPDISEFITPAIVKRGDVMVAISTSGKAPTFARNLRLKINLLLPQNIGEMVDHTHSFRQVVKKMITNSDDLFKFWNNAFSDKHVNRLLGKNEKQSHQYLADLVSKPERIQNNIINIIINSPYYDDLTIKNYHLLNIADVIIYPPDLAEIMNLSRRDAKRICMNTTNLDKQIITPYLNDGNLIICLKMTKSMRLISQSKVVMAHE